MAWVRAPLSLSSCFGSPGWGPRIFTSNKLPEVVSTAGPQAGSLSPPRPCRNADPPPGPDLLTKTPGGSSVYHSEEGLMRTQASRCRDRTVCPVTLGHQRPLHKRCTAHVLSNESSRRQVLPPFSHLRRKSVLSQTLCVQRPH